MDSSAIKVIRLLIIWMHCGDLARPKCTGVALRQWLLRWSHSNGRHPYSERKEAKILKIALWLHLLGVVVWVGGMFFAYMALRPAAKLLEPAQRLPLWGATFTHFFPWVWVSIILIL